MRFLNWSMGTQEGLLLTLFGREGDQWTWSDRENGILTQTDDPERQLPTAGSETIFTFGVLKNMYFNYWFNYDDKVFNDFVNDPANLPRVVRPDARVIYDEERFESANQLVSLDDLYQESFWKVITGAAPVSYWTETFIPMWMANGGEALINDINIQFKEVYG